MLAARADSPPTGAGRALLPPVLEVEDLVVRYGTGHDALTAVDAVSLSVPK